MYGKGGYLLAPVHPGFPRKKLTSKQRKENAAAKKAYAAKLTAARKIMARAQAGLEKLGAYVASADDEDGDDFFSIDPYKPPHDPSALDFDAFTEADKAVYEYTQNYWDNPKWDERALAEKVHKAGVPLQWIFKGMSSGYGVDQKSFERDGPDIPEWAPKQLERGRW